MCACALRAWSVGRRVVCAVVFIFLLCGLFCRFLWWCRRRWRRDTRLSSSSEISIPQRKKANVSLRRKMEDKKTKHPVLLYPGHRLLNQKEEKCGTAAATRHSKRCPLSVHHAELILGRVRCRCPGFSSRRFWRRRWRCCAVVSRFCRRGAC